MLASTIGIHAQATDTSMKCKVLLHADDKFEFFVNGNSVWSGSDYQKILQKEISLRKGDVIVVRVTDLQGGKGGLFAIVIKYSNKVLLRTRDFRYSVDPPDDFLTSSNLKGTRVSDLGRLALSFGLGRSEQPKKAWTHRSDRMHGVVAFKCIVP